MLITPFTKEPLLKFTDDFDITFQQKYGYSLIERLPEVFWETKDCDRTAGDIIITDHDGTFFRSI